MKKSIWIELNIREYSYSFELFKKKSHSSQSPNLDLASDKKLRTGKNKTIWQRCIKSQTKPCLSTC